MEAIVLIQTKVGGSVAVVRAVIEIDGITSADVVAGPYDVIARAEAENIDQLGRLVITRIQTVEGVTRTLTCPILRL